jgi:outer membrane protein TolC
MRRNTLRRNALRAVSNARSSLDQATAEPRLLRRAVVASVSQLDAIEAAIDAHTVSLFEEG